MFNYLKFCKYINHINKSSKSLNGLNTCFLRSLLSTLILPFNNFDFFITTVLGWLIRKNYPSICK